MTLSWSRSAAEIEARTPPDRDRLADFFRALAIVMVILGHWLVVVVVRERDGALGADLLLAVEPWTRWATWAFQVMPLFFFYGGFANARSWNKAARRERARRADGTSAPSPLGWTEWTQRRAQRLLTPLAPLLAFWLVLVGGMRLAGTSGEHAHVASEAAFLPIWFLGIYLLVIVTVPVTWAMHRRWGGLAVAALVAAVFVVDLLARLGVPWVVSANSWIVWAAIHQCGYFWFDQRVPQRRAAGLAFLATGAAGLALLVGLLDYPVSMVTVGGDVPSNASPPTAGILALFTAQLGAIVVTRRSLDRWLHRPRPWAVVATTARITLTLYLWHMTALVLVVLALHASGLWRPPDLGAAWWASRPAWILSCALVLAALVTGFHRLGAAPEAPSRAGPLRLVLGLTGVLVGIAWILRHGLYDPDAPAYSSLLAAALLVAGLVALRAIPIPRHLAGRRRSH